MRIPISLPPEVKVDFDWFNGTKYALSMCDVKMFLTFTSLSLVLL